MYDVSLFLPQYQCQNFQVIHVWELIKALHDMLMQQHYLNSHQQNNECKLGHLIAAFLPSVVKKKFTHKEIHKRNILSHNVSSWCTTKTSKVLKTLERRFAGFSLGHIKVGIAEEKKLRPLKFSGRILLFQAALWF